LEKLMPLTIDNSIKLTTKSGVKVLLFCYGKIDFLKTTSPDFFVE